MVNKKYTSEQFIEAVNTSESIAEVCRKINIAPKGGNYQTVKNKIKELQLDDSHFTGQAWNKGKRYKLVVPARSLDEILVKDSVYSSSKLAKRILKAGLKEHKCEKCGKTEHEGQPIPLELHHINGDHYDNRLENLQLLCPLCHALTPNFRGKNQKTCKSFYDKERIEELSGEDLRIHDEARELALKKGIRILEAENLLLTSPNKSISDFIEVKEKIKEQKTKIIYRLENKICPICGKEFHPRNHEQIYCSSECVAKSQRKVEITKKELIQLAIDKNCNFTQMGKELGVSDNAVRKYCDKFDIPRKRKDLENYIKNSDDPDYVKPENTKMNRTHDFNLICEIYKEGYSQKDIAAYIGCCQDTVRKALLQNNIPIRNKSLKKIGRYSLDGELLQVYYSGEEAMLWLFNQGIAKSTGGNHHIFECCRKKTQSAYGFKWEFIPRKPITEFNKE